MDTLKAEIESLKAGKDKYKRMVEEQNKVIADLESTRSTLDDSIQETDEDLEYRRWKTSFEGNYFFLDESPELFVYQIDRRVRYKLPQIR